MRWKVMDYYIGHFWHMPDEKDRAIVNVMENLLQWNPSVVDTLGTW